MKRALIAALLLLPTTVFAQVCVQVDESRDTLSPEDRRGAQITLSHVVSKYGETVVESGCAATYTVYHVKLGQTVSVYLYGPQGARDAKASKLDDLPDLYEQMVSSLRSGQPMNTGLGSNIDRTNVTSDQTAPRRISADNVKYVRLGYGLIIGHELSNGPAFGLGWRHELDAIAIDISAFNLIFATDNDDKGVAGSWVQLCALWFAQPLGNNSAYLGGGLSWGAGFASHDGIEYGGTGLQGQVVAGYELARASTIRLFGQVDLGLPFYRLSADDGDGKRWVPMIAFSLGLGWGKSNTSAIVMR
jgi:hypothetical protein